MCLYVEPGSRKVAKEDIHVWKAIAVDKKDPDKWFGPFISNLKRFNFNEKIDIDITPDESSMNLLKCKDADFLEVGDGFIHSCDSHTRASHMLYMTAYHNSELGGHVVEAIIPKGSAYYKQRSIYGDHYYASSSIIVKKPENL